jgi:hypothetical protein
MRKDSRWRRARIISSQGEDAAALEQLLSECRFDARRGEALQDQRDR